MSYNFTAAADTNVGELSERVAQAIHDIRSFECRKNAHIKEEAQWRIYHALVDCADFIERITQKEVAV